MTACTLIQWMDAVLVVANTEGMPDDQAIPTWPEDLCKTNPELFPELTVGAIREWHAAQHSPQPEGLMEIGHIDEGDEGAFVDLLPGRSFKLNQRVYTFYPDLHMDLREALSEALSRLPAPLAEDDGDTGTDALLKAILPYLNTPVAPDWTPCAVRMPGPHDYDTNGKVWAGFPDQESETQYVGEAELLQMAKGRGDTYWTPSGLRKPSSGPKSITNPESTA